MDLYLIFKNNDLAKSNFLEWFYKQKPNFSLKTLQEPEFLVLPLVVAWLDDNGIYIDRDTQDCIYKIWDYRSNEPEDFIEVDFIHGDKPIFSLREAVLKALEIYLQAPYVKPDITKKDIENTVKDLVKDFIYYDRKNDEDLSQEQLLNAFDKGTITQSDVVKMFKNALSEKLEER